MSIHVFPRKDGDKWGKTKFYMHIMLKDILNSFSYS